MHGKTRPLIAIGALVLLLLLWSSWRGKNETEQQWRRLRAFADDHVASQPTAPVARASLLGATEPGEAFAHYDAAVAALEASGFDADEPGTAVSPADVLRELRAGAMAAARRRPALRELVDDPEKTFFHYLDVARTAFVAARRSRDDADAALDLLTAALQLGLDSGEIPCLIGEMTSMGILGLAAKEFDEAWLSGLPPAQLRRVGVLLAAVDAAVPLELQSLAAETAAMVLVADKLDVATRSSVREHATALLAYDDLLHPVPGVPWSRRKDRLELVDSNRRRNGVGSDLVSHEIDRRRTAASLRMARIAVAFRLGDELPRLRDPFGDGDLEVETTGGGIQIRCAAGDGEMPMMRLVVR